MYQGGLINYMRYSVSDTAEHGDYTGGPQVIGRPAREAMKQILAAVRDGSYAREWIEEVETGGHWFEAQRIDHRERPVEVTGTKLRAMMPFIDPVVVSPGEREGMGE